VALALVMEVMQQQILAQAREVQVAPKTVVMVLQVLSLLDTWRKGEINGWYNN
jgi:hypothetical protein